MGVKGGAEGGVRYQISARVVVSGIVLSSPSFYHTSDRRDGIGDWLGGLGIRFGKEAPISTPGTRFLR